MSGDPDKASIWGDADVYVGPVDAVNPVLVTNPFPGTWGLVGLLDGEAGFEESRSRDSTDFFAWGGLLIRTSRRNFVLTRKFTALEDNLVVMGLVWPGSGPGVRAIPKPNARFKLGFETVDGDTTKRAITRRYAEIEEIGTIKDSESDLTKYEITVKIYPDADGILFDLQPVEGGRTLTSIDVQPATKTISASGDIYAKLVVTATFSDASTLVVTDQCTFTSSDPTKATVDRGYVDGIAVGTATITAKWGGTSDTAVITVTA